MDQTGALVFLPSTTPPPSSPPTVLSGFFESVFLVLKVDLEFLLTRFISAETVSDMTEQREREGEEGRGGRGGERRSWGSEEEEEESAKIPSHGSLQQAFKERPKRGHGERKRKTLFLGFQLYVCCLMKKCSLSTTVYLV